MNAAVISVWSSSFTEVCEATVFFFGKISLLEINFNSGRYCCLLCCLLYMDISLNCHCTSTKGKHVKLESFVLDIDENAEKSVQRSRIEGPLECSRCVLGSVVPVPRTRLCPHQPLEQGTDNTKN